MTNEQLKAALLSGCPVDFKGTVYKCVSGIIYHNVDGKLDISAELTDKSNNNSVIIVNPWWVSEVENDKKRKKAAK